MVLRDILYPLTSGATLVIPSREWILDPRKILSWFKKRRITSMHCVPSLMKAWLRASKRDDRLTTLRRIFFAGEPLPSSLIEEVKRRSSSEIQIVNLYGPTETTLAKLSKVVTEPEPGIQPVGKPQPGVDAFICRDRKYRCGLWEVGEIAIRTPYRSLGYYNNPDLTTLSFLPNPFRKDESDLIYYTGDLGRLRPDGVVEIFGRVDYQIKVNGLRIEPVEIEAELVRNPSVVDAAITLRANQDGEKMLWAILVLVDDYSDHYSLAPLQRDLRQQLKLLFPDAMIPRRFHVVDSLPYLPNGKINRKEINRMDLSEDENSSIVSDFDLDEESSHRLLELEKDMGQQITDLDETFRSMGGDSLSSIQVSWLFEKHLGHLPDDWDSRPFHEVVTASGASAQASYIFSWSSIDTTILFRAVAIVLIVVSHTDISDAFSNEHNISIYSRILFKSAALLLAISGYSYGKYLAPVILDSGNLLPTWRFIVKYAIPAFFLQLIRDLSWRTLWIPDLFLLGTLWQNPHGAHLTYWFLDILTANLVILSLLAKGVYLTGKGFWFKQHQFAVITLLTCVFFFIGLLQQSLGVWDGELGSVSVAPFKWLWIFTLGWAASLALRSPQRVVLTLLIVAMFLMRHLLNHPVFDKTYDLLGDFMIPPLLIIIWIKQIAVPRFLKPSILAVSKATLFIYLLNQPVIYKLMPLLKIPKHLAIQVLMAIGVGIASYYLWQEIGHYAYSLFNRHYKRFINRSFAKSHESS